MKAERITTMTMAEIKRRLANGEDRTDWARLDREEAAGIEPELDEEEIGIEWGDAIVVIPSVKRSLSLRLDADILAYFKSQGPGYQTRINAVLRSYMEARLKAG